MNEHGAVLSALVDGQVVDPVALRAALEQPDGVQLLVDFAALRARLVEDAQTPSGQFYESWQARRRSAGRRATSLRLMAAAVILMGAACGGYWLASGLGTPMDIPSVAASPPQASRTQALLPSAPCSDLQVSPPAGQPSLVMSPTPTRPVAPAVVPPTPSRIFHLSNDLARVASGGEQEN